MPLLEIDGAVCQRAVYAHRALLRIAKTSSGRVPKTETDDACGRREGICSLHGRGGKGISRGRRTAGGDAQRAALTILGAEGAGM